MFKNKFYLYRPEVCPENSFLNILNAHLSDLSWKTEICRPKDLRGGAFRICLVESSGQFGVTEKKVRERKPQLRGLLFTFPKQI